MREKSKLANEIVKIKSGAFKGEDYHVEDWAENVFNGSWKRQEGNPACLEYAVRNAKENLPSDDEVLYGKVGLLGKLIHISQIER